MPVAEGTPVPFWRRFSLRSRVTAMIIAILANLLLVWMLLHLAEYSGRPNSNGTSLATFNVADQKEPSPKKAAKQEQKREQQPVASVRTKINIIAAEKPPVPAKFKMSDLGILDLSRKDFAQSDVGKLPQHAAEAGSGDTQGQGAGGSGEGDTPSTGGGPNGERLYYAEWYREPTDAELETYVRGRASPGAWAEIACRTVARYHVDDCQELGDSPPGSRLANAVRQAAFQFLVRPPRVGGRSLVGAWVRIRITFSQRAVER